MATVRLRNRRSRRTGLLLLAFLLVAAVLTVTPLHEIASFASAQPSAPQTLVAIAAAPKDPPAAPAPPVVTSRLRTSGAGACADRVDAIAAAASDSVVRSDTVTTWAKADAGSRLVGVTIGQKYAEGSPVPFAATSVVATPVGAGRCDAMAVQVVPSPLSCATLRESLSARSRQIGDLVGIPVMSDAAGQTLLVPTGANGCVLVGIRSDYAP